MGRYLEIFQDCISKHPNGKEKNLSVERTVKVLTESAMMAIMVVGDELQKPKTISDKVIAVESAKYAERVGINPISAKLDFEAGMKKLCELMDIEVLISK